METTEDIVRVVDALRLALKEEDVLCYMLCVNVIDNTTDPPGLVNAWVSEGEDWARLPTSTSPLPGSCVCI